MNTEELKAKRSQIKAQIADRLSEIAKDDEAVKNLYAQLDDINEQLGASEANDMIFIDKTNRKTDASLGTSAR